MNDELDGVDLLPSQYADHLRPSTLPPLQKLFYAVLIDALREFQRFRRQPEHRRYREALDWLLASNDGPFSYDTICGELGIDGERLFNRVVAEDCGRVPRRSPASYDKAVAVSQDRRTNHHRRAI
jgi:hypothetical protein